MNARKQGVAEAGAPCRAVVVLHMNRHAPTEAATAKGLTTGAWRVRELVRLLLDMTCHDRLD
ncbi:hypothetical protein NK983_28235, partial [Salmonella enterica subsp. enterica serovar Typhimurium]|nr:hypothetical protein [Salmonella enterica subsp. enterica serovar Typhimurium]